MAAGEALELHVRGPWAIGDMVEFQIVVSRDGIIVQRVPEHHTISAQVPGPDFSARHWSA